MHLTGDCRFRGIAYVCLIRISEIVAPNAWPKIIMLGKSRSVYAENIGNIFSFQIEKLGFGIEINSDIRSPSKNIR